MASVSSSEARTSASGQGRHRASVQLGPSCHLGGDLPAGRPVVQCALGGDHQVGAGRPGVRGEVVEQDVEAGQESGAQATGGADAGTAVQIGAGAGQVAGEASAQCRKPADNSWRHPQLSSPIANAASRSCWE